MGFLIKVLVYAKSFSEEILYLKFGYELVSQVTLIGSIEINKTAVNMKEC
jgi:hypothetical protein